MRYFSIILKIHICVWSNFLPSEFLELINAILPLNPCFNSIYPNAFIYRNTIQSKANIFNFIQYLKINVFIYLGWQWHLCACGKIQNIIINNMQNAYQGNTIHFYPLLHLAISSNSGYSATVAYNAQQLILIILVHFYSYIILCSSLHRSSNLVFGPVGRASKN